jgi:hypothetical protein
VVELPSIPNVVPQVRAPESRVTPAQIAAPYQELAQNLSKAGEVVDKDIAQPLAARAGEEAVSADGKTVTQPGFPIIGAASAEFARAARFTALGKMTPDIENKLAEIRIQHANDPGGFQSAVKGFKNTYSTATPRRACPASPTRRSGACGNAPSCRAAAPAIARCWRRPTRPTHQTPRSRSPRRFRTCRTKMTQLAFTGKVDSADYRVAQGNLGALYQELGRPALGYPKERVASEISELTSQHKTMAIAGEAVRMMDGTSPTARADAKKWLIDKVYNDQSLNLSLAQRHQAVTTAMGLMEARSAENKALIDANKAQVNTLLTNLHSNQPYNPIAINDAHRRTPRRSATPRASTRSPSPRACTTGARRCASCRCRSRLPR